MSLHVVHFHYGCHQGVDHAGPEFGIVRVPPGVAGDQAKLAHQILDVVHDEGEAAVELLETLRFGKRLLPLRFGYVAGHLPSDDAQHVQILPVKLPPDERPRQQRSEEHTSELQPLMRISYAVFCLQKQTDKLLSMTNKR